MTEASLTQDLLRTLKERLPGAVVLKICDRFTAGIPDIAITWRGFTSWLEVKLLTKGNTFGRCSPPVQRVTMARLFQQSGGRAWYVVYDAREPRAKRLWICAPEQLADPMSGGTVVSGFEHALVATIIAEASRAAA
jgi:hypothetical protein